MPNIYNAVVFTGNVRIGMNGYIKYRKINNKRRFESFVNSKYPMWKFINWYDRKTGNKTTQKR